MMGLQETAFAVREILTDAEILRDYRLMCESRQISLIGRREVLSGRAKFGIFGDGKEAAQIALAKTCQPGDFRSGYYRGQTLMLALELLTTQQFFAQLYAHTDLAAEPHSGGRQMNAHFATRSLNPDGSWRDLTRAFNSSADLSPTGSQMPRLVGLAYASRLYRELPELSHLTQFSRQGNEVAFGMIGNASCAEGMFWESINAAGVLRAPMVLSIWDDGYGISVPNEYQLAKPDLSELLRGFQRQPGSQTGLALFSVPGWDYPALVETYQQANRLAREEHTPVIVHVTEVTQPQGHSTSGSHERYKSAERLAWEEEFDCLRKMREWLLTQGIATAAALDEINETARQDVLTAKDEAWQAYTAFIQADKEAAAKLIGDVGHHSPHAAALQTLTEEMLAKRLPVRRDILTTIHQALVLTRQENSPARQALGQWRRQREAAYRRQIGSHLHSESAESALHIPAIPPLYTPNSPTVNGFEIVNACFDAMLARDPRVLFFGEDVGRLGDVNQGLAGLQAKYGELRVSDTGIRETTIIGQAIGLALRGLRPVAEIQYLDYLLYCLQIISDDLATLHWRTVGGQKAPVIIRTRGHRLEGIWHSGSPMAGVINLVRGLHVLVPRDMTRAAGFYNTLLLADEPGLIVEVLNGYRLKETLPANIDTLTVPLGVPEVLREGRDVTVVTYGACCQVAREAADLLAEAGVDMELIDVQSLLPFDIHHRILESLKKTSRIVFLDEDVPGGATAYMLQQVIERQGGYDWLDSPPVTLSAQAHRPAYGTDGNYFSKPNAEDVFETVYELMHEADPRRYPLFYA